MKLSRLLLSLYPHHWRERYGDEFAAMLQMQRLTLTDVLDVVLNALDAHINPKLWFIDGLLDEKGNYRMQKLRSGEIMIFAAWIAFVVAGLNLYALMDDSPYIAAMNGLNGPGIIPSLELSNPLVVSYDVLAAGSLIALLAILVGGLPVAYVTWQRAPQERRRFFVPVIAFAAIVLPLVIAIGLYLTSGFNPHGVLWPVMNVAYGAWFIAWAIASTRAVTRAISRADIDARIIHFAYVPGIIATMAMVLMLGATIAWGIFAHIHTPQFFDSANYFVGYPTLISWGLIILVMTIATVCAVVGCIRGIPARNDPEQGAIATA